MKTLTKDAYEVIELFACMFNDYDDLIENLKSSSNTDKKVISVITDYFDNDALSFVSFIKANSYVRTFVSADIEARVTYTTEFDVDDSDDIENLELERDFKEFCYDDVVSNNYSTCSIDRVSCDEILEEITMISYSEYKSSNDDFKAMMKAVA